MFGTFTRACRVSASHAKGKVKGILSMVRKFESYIIHGKGWYSWVIYFRLLSVPLLFYGWSMIILCTLVWLIRKEYWVTLPTWYQTLLTINPCCLTNCTFGNKPCDKHSFLFPGKIFNWFFLSLWYIDGLGSASRESHCFHFFAADFHLNLPGLFPQKKNFFVLTINYVYS